MRIRYTGSCHPRHIVYGSAPVPSRSSRPTQAVSKQRRAFSPARTPGRLDRGGDPVLAQTLEHALAEAQRDEAVAESLTHPLHTYPARLHPATARALVPVVMDGRSRGMLLDPFCGSGTTLVEGCYAGLGTVGVDANPLAVLMARAKTWVAPPARRALLNEIGRAISLSALSEGKAARRSGHEPAPERAPGGMDPAERNRRLLSWFAPHVRRELEHLAAEIDEVATFEPELADILTVVLSAILYKVSRRASDTDPSRVERRVGRGAAARLFRQRLDQLLDGLDELARRGAMPGRIHLGDARKLAGADLGDGSVDAVITSPPYAGTYDYTEQHQLRLDFLGMSSHAFGRAELGSRRQFAGDGHERRRARRRFTRALGASLAEMARVLRPGGRAVVVLGDSVAGDRVMWADEAVAAALPELMTVRAWAWQSRPKHGLRERDAFADRPKREHLFLLERAG